MLITRPCDPHMTRNDLISMEEGQEITFDIFEILLNFRVFLCFFENFQKLSVFWGLKCIGRANFSGSFRIKSADPIKHYYARKNGPSIH